VLVDSVVLPDVEVVDDRPRLQLKEQALGEARSIFLETLALTVPELLTELHRDILPVYRAIPDSIKVQNDSGPETMGLSEDGKKVLLHKLPNVLLWRNLAKYGDVKEVVTLKQALWDWAERYDLHAPWLLDSALQTLDVWSNPDPETGSEQKLFFGDLHFATIPKFYRATSEIVSYSHVACGVNQVWDDYEQQQLEAFRQYSARHRDSRLGSEYGLPPQIGNYDHFVWVALAYGKRLNFAEIMDQYHPKNRDPRLHPDPPTSHIVADGRPRKPLDDTTIGKAVRAKAKMIGLPKLHTKQGRPSKRNSKSGSR
jgi:hypothetical protein